MNNVICNEKVSEKGRVNLFIFPCSGGTASSYHHWREHLSEEINIYPVQYPMREKRARDAMPESIKLLAQSLAEDCMDIIKGGKFAFLGDCSGSLVAYEASVYLSEKYGISPEKIFVVSSPSPDISNPMYFKDKLISQLNDEEFIEFLKENMTFPEEFYANKFAVDYYRKIVKTDFKMVEEYDYSSKTKLGCGISVFFGKTDPYMNEDQSNGWKNFTDHVFEHQVLDGGHNIFETHPKEICQDIERSLLA